MLAAFRRLEDQHFNISINKVFTLSVIFVITAGRVYFSVSGIKKLALHTRIVTIRFLQKQLTVKSFKMNKKT